MSAVTIAELEAYLGVDLDAAQEARVQIVLNGLQGELEGWLGRPIEVRAFTEDYAWTGTEDMLAFRNTPVATVTSVTAVTVTTAGETTDLVEVEYYTVTPWGLSGLISAIPSLYPYLLRIVYTAGLDLTDAKYKGISAAILKAAERWYHAAGAAGGSLDESAGGTIQSLATDGGYSVTFADGGPLDGGAEGAGSFTMSELNAIRRFKRKG